ncbi:phosphonate metabolism transcriptional regulator PhnF [Mariprofundus sp. EBB-1]|uniref:phosphonate metabolism transcriptional regulator PhnF n=1 Tax=Mariprofundus sp. EBB-1 TaxID=2650971 RepID=UPI000EF1D514|nr:phosphonate metabolism transcriptional regulator PhnF [Mariprofundus sp. EBB-1]RLL52718.1 phosphonate metabolism transcriptional regulator PhnF [Mariprofundus sp. EBB-1]
MSRKVLLRSTGDKALYRQIAELLTLEIRKENKHGDFLPSESDMAERFGVNRHTLRKAIDVLAIKGLVHRQHGRRIVVNERPVQYEIHSGVQFSKNMETLGVDWSSEVAELEFIEAPEEVSQAMGRDIDDMVFMRTVRYINETPACVSTHYLTSECRKALQSYEGGSLHDYLQQSCGLRLRRGSCHVSVALMDAEAAMYLHMPIGAPMLCVDSINFNRSTGEAVELSRSLFRGDLIKLNIEMSNHGEENEQN